MPPGSVLAHGVHLTEAEVKRAGEAGAWLVYNPRSNAGNRVGFARALAASSRVALGTDGYPADMTAERAAAVEAGVDAATADARLACGARIAAERFGGDWSDEPVELRADLEEIRARAREQAPRLFEKMRRL